MFKFKRQWALHCYIRNMDFVEIMRKYYKLVLILILNGVLQQVAAQPAPESFRNPILPGFNPDPSVCRVGDDYYLVTSSFTWYPGLPVYHSKDLVNWRLIGHGIERTDQLDMRSVDDKNGIWAPTIRHHEGTFYIITTCNTCGGNFYITAEDPAGPWSAPVWLKDAPGIDPSLFWDDDGRCYYTGNDWGINKPEDRWPGQAVIWIQEIDLKQNKFLGERKYLTYGHAHNAKYAEAPHIYKVKDKYILLIGEGGTDHNHSVTVHSSSSILGPYMADQINPVITHRHLGQDYPIHAVGHADLVQTQNGDWWAVLLAKRTVGRKVPLGRETFLCKVDFEGTTPIFNKGYGKVLAEQTRPDLSWAPWPQKQSSVDWLAIPWYTIRTPQKPFYSLEAEHIAMQLIPETLDNLIQTPVLLRRVTDHQFTATAKVSFDTNQDYEQAGLVLYRTTNSYYVLTKERCSLVLYKKIKEEKKILARVPYTGTDVYLQVDVNNLDIDFRYGASKDELLPVAEKQSLVDLADNQVNRFNGLGVGFYSSSNGKKSKNKAMFADFTYYRPE